MKKMDPHTLFSIFEAGDEEVYEEHNMTELLENPFVLMGMVVRGVQNYRMMDILHLRHYGEGYKKVRSQVRNTFYNKLYGYLKRVDDTKFESKYTIGESFNKNEVNDALDTLLYYYEKREEYEKCAIIKKYSDFLYIESQEITKVY